MKAGDKVYIHSGDFAGVYAKVVNFTFTPNDELLGVNMYVYNREGTELIQSVPSNVDLVIKLK